MQILDRVRNCNGCSACIVGCKEHCIKMVERENGKFPEIYEGGCNKCNNCVLYCPLFNAVELPKFENFFEYDEKFYNRDMPKVYRKTMRSIRSGAQTEFIGTLCQIAGLKSLLGDRLARNLTITPLYCDPNNPKRKECNGCIFLNHESEKE